MSGGDAAADRAELLRRRLSGRLGRSTDDDAITVVPRDGRLRCSFGQERLWFLSTLAPDSPEYHVPVALRLRGPVDVEALRSALTAVVGRHEILRTRYAFAASEPLQVVDEPAPAPLTVIGLDDRPPAGRLAAAVAAATRDLAVPFDLGLEHPLRCTLYRLGPHDHVLAVVAHHIAFDGWSARVLVDETFSHYATAVSGTDADPAPLPVQYADVAAWERRRMSGARLDEHLMYWRDQLSDLRPLELPTDRPRPPVREWAGDGVTFNLGAPLAARLRALAVDHDTTLFTVGLTIFEILLARHAGQRDIAIGTAMTGRERPELRSLIGFFLRTVVVRARWSGDPTVAELLAASRRTVVDAVAHADAPMQLLVPDIDRQRDLSRPPVFQVMFDLVEPTPPPHDLGDLTIAPLDVAGAIAKHDLRLELREQAGGTLAGRIEYPTSLFDRGTVQRMAGHYAALASAVVDDPDRALSTLGMLGTRELRQLRASSTGPTVAPSVGWVPDAVAEWARRTPDAPAVLGDDVRLSYAELDAAANRLARHLRDLDVCPERLVAVCLTRGPALLPALLGIWRAGGAYLPLDPGDPPARLRRLLREADVDVVLTDAATGPPLDDSSRRTVLVDAHGGAIAARSGAPFATTFDADRLAYVVFTSGSTGAPKGVQVEHGALQTYLDWSVHAYAPDGAASAPLFSSVAFDLVVTTLYVPLLTGGTVHLMAADLDTADLADHLLAGRDGRYDFVKMTPAHLELLAHQLGPDRADALADRLVAGGDLFHTRLARWWHDHTTDRPVVLFNEYGPTETTVGDMTHRSSASGDVDADAAPTAVALPIGRPTPNSTAHVLDAELGRSPIGAVGQLYLGGAQLSRGYLGQPATTAERFVPDPFGQPGARMYRSGDLARVLASGDLEFAGRVDDQLQIRGHRIEPAEVVAALLDHPHVDDAVVRPRVGEDGPDALVAYIVAGAQDPQPAELRRFVEERLAAHLVPSAYVPLPRIPLTPNGKVDLGALPDPDRAAAGVDGRRIAPRTRVEEQIATAMGRVLRVDDIGIADPFFEVGGDSLSAVALVGQLRDAGMEVSVHDLFGHPTVADLAALVEERPDAEQTSHVDAFELISRTDRDRLPTGIVDAYPLSTLQAGMALEMLSGGDVHYYHNVTSFTIREPSDTYHHDAFQQAVDEVVARREVLRTGFELRGYSEPLQLVHADAVLPVGLSDLRGRSAPVRDEAVRRHIAHERGHPFDVTAPPLLRLHVHLHDARGWSLTITEYHPILEGWSFHSLLMDILDCYRQIRDHGAPEPDDPPAVTFADFIAAERASIAEGDDLDHWRAALDGVARFTLPPAWGDPDPAATDPYRVDIMYADLLEDLEVVAAAADAPLKSVLHAAHLKVLSMLTHDTSFFAGLICDTRPEVLGADRLYGLFLNAVPFPFTVARRTWTQLVRDVFATEADLWAHRRYPMAMLQQALGGGRLVDVIFNYLDFRVVDDELVDFTQVIDDSPTEFLLNVTAFRQGMVTLRLHPRAVSRGDAQRLAAMYRGVLAAMAADPDGDALAAHLPAQERRRVLWDLNDTAVARDDVTLPELFERQVAADPEAIAVVAADGATTTYGELDRRANRLAHALVEVGVDPEDVVGIRLPRGVALVAAVLAVGKASAAYLPLDPAHPPERAADMLTDAGATLLLAVDDGTAAGTDVHIVDADARHEGQSPKPPVRRLAADNLAYVLYTSGSTGRPKGVMVSHAGLANYLLWAAGAYGVGASAGSPLMTSVAFDLTVTSLLLPLIRGRAVTLLPDDADIAQQAVHVGTAPHVGTVKLVPSHLDLLASQWSDTAAAGVTDVVVGGEELFVETVRKARHRAPGLRILNEYGPTETVVGCTTYSVPPDPDPSRRIPIGRPIANTRLYVLDDALEPVPIGVPGELYIGGAVVSRGYRARPGLTAERYVPDPYATMRGARCYRTGDLVSVRPDGDVVFHARVDDQLKIHGYRIEPAEIEAALTAHPAVAATAVTAYRPPDGDQRLVAHVVGANGDQPAAEPLRAFLRSRLPDHLVPATIVPIAELPRSTAGKVDRAALPPPADSRADVMPFVAARNATERRLADIWRRLLGLDRIGVHDDLVSLGADSLSGLRLAAEAADLGFDVDPLTVLAHATIADQSRHLLGGDSSDAVAEMVRDAQLDPAIRPHDRSSAGGAAVLLTGATGFLGAGLLEQLLRRTDGRVICLVRARDDGEAAHRLRDELELWASAPPGVEDRVEAVAGDLSAPRFGLDPARWQGLAEGVHAVYHCAASTNAVHPYRTMRRTNVDGTLEVLRLACLGPDIHVHHVSTMSVFSDEAFDAGDIDEDSVQDRPPYPSNGYAQSKWVAETLVREAGRRGVPTTIYRMGKVSWDSRTGRFNDTDMFSRILTACIELGASPAAPYAMTLTPVDHVAAGIVDAGTWSDVAGRTIHLVSRHRVRWRELRGWLNRAGVTVREIDYESWRERIVARTRQPGGEHLGPVALILPSVEDGFDITDGVPDDYVPPTPTTWERRTSGCPPVDEGSFGVLLARMVGRELATSSLQTRA